MGRATPSVCSKFIVIVAVITPLARAHDVNFIQCFNEALSHYQDVIPGSIIPGLVSVTGMPITNISFAAGLTYDYCTANCGSGAEPFIWAEFSQQFSSWLLPWLALVSQLPFGAKDNVGNLSSVVLAVGSPTLAAYSLALTALNARWAAKTFRDVSYPNSKQALRILTAMHQLPLRFTSDPELLASLVVLPENDHWWKSLSDWLEYNHTWSIPVATQVAWVAIAYIITVISSFTTPPPGPELASSVGQAYGSIWLWLFPVVVGWLQMSPQSKTTPLENVISTMNHGVHLAPEKGLVKRGSPLAVKALVWRVQREFETVYNDEMCTAPIFNYARLFPWSRTVEQVSDRFHDASRRAAQYERVDGSLGWRCGSSVGVVHCDNRQGSREQVMAYCAPEDLYSTRSNWELGIWTRLAIASVAALMLQWGTMSGAFLSAWFTHPVGLGCISITCIIYAGASTLVWLLLMISTLLIQHLDLTPDAAHEEQSNTFQGSTSRDHNHQKPPLFHKVIQITAVLLRQTAMTLAICNAIFVILASILQFSNLYERCWCNASYISLKHRAYILLSGIHLNDNALIVGVVISFGSAMVFLAFINLLMYSPV